MFRNKYWKKKKSLLFSLSYGGFHTYFLCVRDLHFLV